MRTAHAHVVIDGTRNFDLDDSDTLWIGREDSGSGRVGLDPGDLGISRVAGSIQRSEGQWLLTNRSASVPLYLDLEAGHPMPRLMPGQHHVIGERLVVIVKGIRRMHRIDIITDVSVSEAATLGVSGDTAVGITGLDLTEGQLDALAAVFRGFLVEFPRRNCLPLSYAEAGALLGVPGSTVRKRIERVRAKLTNAGVYVDGPHARFALADVVLDASIVTADDLARLRSPREHPTARTPIDRSSAGGSQSQDGERREVENE